MRDIAIRIQIDAKWSYANESIILSPKDMQLHKVSLEDFLLNREQANKLFLHLITNYDHIEAIAMVQMATGFGGCSEYEVLEYKELLN